MNASEAARILGSIKSEKKAASSRLNGLKGGRKPGYTKRQPYSIRIDSESVGWRSRSTMVIIDKTTGDELAEYPLTLGDEINETARMRRTLNKHLATAGGTLNNYQW